VAQKLSTTTLPRRSASLAGLPSSSKLKSCGALPAMLGSPWRYVGEAKISTTAAAAASPNPPNSFLFNDAAPQPIISRCSGSARADLPIQFPSVGYKTMSLAGSVSAIVPARDEQATIARAVLSLAAQPEIGEIIVINDQSTYGTRAILEELAASVPKLRVLETQHSPAGAANGQYLLIRRDVYDAIGGHRSVAGEVLEDVALARRAKQAGYALHFAPGQGIARVRMYRSFAGMWQGWTKNLYPLVGGSAGAVAWELVAVIPWIPLGLLLFGWLHWAFRALGLALLCGRLAAYAAALRRNHFPVSCILYYVLAV